MEHSGHSPRNLPLTQKFVIKEINGKPKTVVVDRDPFAYPKWMKRRIKRERGNQPRSVK